MAFLAAPNHIGTQFDTTHVQNAECYSETFSPFAKQVFNRYFHIVIENLGRWKIL